MAGAAGSVRVLIADDHPIFRAGLRKLLESEPGYEVVGEAADGADVVPQVSRCSPDILLLDVVMPGTGGIEALRQLARAGVPVRTVLLTAAVEDADAVEALRLGASGILLKSAATELLFECLQAVQRGQVWVGRDTVSSVVEALRTIGKEKAATPQGRPFGLTLREAEGVALIVAGASNKEIATRLAISEETVKHHLTHIFEKTGQSTRVQLAIFALKHNLAGGG